ncbi:MAG: protein kinase domain-containing protein [Planctomycetota bacterium]
MSDAKEKNGRRPGEDEVPPTASFSNSVPGPGGQIGPFRIEGELGRGAVGVVYLAHDTKLDRPVAIKSLPAEVMANPKARSRFAREARVLASLNHPNIATIYDEFQETEDVAYLILEYVPGQTLAERIAKSQLKLEETLSIALQIAEAVAAAHEHDVIHRDLKPGNIKITPEGKVKVLDFGLAKAVGGEALDQQSTVTEPGRVIGTPAYMSPEQARGKPADKRSDIWSFGCVLYEMLSGRVPFKGETISDTLAGILEHEPNWQALSQNTPANIRSLLRHCLKKDPRRRLQHIGDADIEITETLSSLTVSVATVEKMRPVGLRRLMAWAVVCLLVGAIAALHFGQAPEELRTMRFLISPPEKMSFRPFDHPVVSADGQQIVFSGLDESGNAYLWVRKMDSLSAQKLSGTEGAALPFWSPDSRFIGFFAEGKLKKIDASGGPPLTLAEAPLGLGGTWSRDGTIVFAPAFAGPLHRVSAAGGEATPVTTLDQSRQETAHRYPYFLPDGRHFLYLAGSPQQEESGIYIGSVDSKESKFLLRADSNVVYAPPDFLLFGREQTLMAQPFDVKKLQITAEPFPIVEQVGRWTFISFMTFSVSENGVLSYRSGGIANSRLVWFDRAGKKLGEVGEPGEYSNPALSPDERRLAVCVFDRQSMKRDIWIGDLTRGTTSRFTFDPADDTNPVWSPDGSRIIFTSERKGQRDLYEKAASGTGQVQLLLESEYFKHAEDWSSDGKFLVYNALPRGGQDLWVLPLSGGDEKPRALLEEAFSEHQAQFSPNGRWIAYTSDETGRSEVYVQTFPPAGGKWQVSTAGGLVAKWRRDGKELFYIERNKLMAVEVNTDGSTFEAGIPKALFETHIGLIRRNPYLVTGDGQRFLIITPVEQTTSPITVVLNWFEELKRRVPPGKR